MDSTERLIELQIGFAKKETAIAVSILIFMGINFLLQGNAGMNIYLTTVLVFAVILLDVLFSLKKYFHSIKAIKIIKTMEIMFTGLLIDNCAEIGVGGFSDLFVIMIFFMFCVELGYIVDLTETSKIYLVALVLHLPYALKFIFNFFVKNDISGLADKSLPRIYGAFNLLTIACVSYIILTAVYSYISELQRYNTQCLFAKDRMLDRAREDYGDIAEKQNRIMSANELLGVKKYELEQAYRQINIINNDINFQNKIMKIASSSLDLNKIINKCSDAMINNEHDIFYAGIMFKNKQLNKYYSKQLEKILDPVCFDEFYDFFLSDAFLDEQAESGNFFVCNDVSYDEYPFLEKSETRSMIIKPIIVQAEGYECIYIILSRVISTFKDKEVLYDNILRQIETAGNNIFMYNKIMDLSNKDGLTGLYNRRYLNLYFNEHFLSNTVNGTAVAALFDIDHFKSINDTYGHLFGDLALVTISSVVNKIAAQNNGLAFRYGGEEFVVLFENISLEDAVTIMERMRHSIKETPIENEQHSIHANVSVGIAAFPDTVKDVAMLIDRADKAMYYSKQNGRDRLTIDSESL